MSSLEFSRGAAPVPPAGQAGRTGRPGGAREANRGRPAFDAHDPLGIDDLLSDEDRAVRDTLRSWAADRVLPHIAEWYERGELPGIRELARELGSIGALGMSLKGYGCAGAGAVQYGLACLELEAADSGVRSLVSVQGSLAMYAIHRFGSEEQKQQWLPRMASGEVIGCFGLTEPDHGSDPAAMRTYAKRDGSDWVLTGRKMWITNGSVAGVAVVWARTEDEGIRGFVVPADRPGFSAPEVRHKWSLRASVTSELVLDEVRLPADAVLPEVSGLRGPLSCLSHARYGIVWGAMGAARTCFETALDYAGSREQFGKPIGGFQLTQAKLADMAVELHKGILLAHHLGVRMDAGTLRPEQVSFGKLNNVREAIEICRTARTVLGANGISLEYPVMRHATNLESVLTYEGTVEMHQLILGKALTGLDAFRG
ncbi:acyl-CoA dehydrogenase family protein [Streptomyces boncukensis]|uniref:acyl-CoA dehydrogenase family protein n=1 Tax=Streptomyces boncukensis TaxID=2711219 RepID=UPI001F49DB8A|nr:acyl-CoA dehydrogenase family protein [Streptomyces boncukensis]